MNQLATSTSAPTGRLFPRFWRNLAVLALLWWVLTRGRWDSWVVGAPTVALATAMSLHLGAKVPARWSATGVLRFILCFLRWSFLGGIDVAWRSLHPRLPIDPQILEYRMRLPNGNARIFFVGVLNLLPGTVGVDLSNDAVMVHVIDGRQPVHRHLEELEVRVAGAFRIDLEATGDQTV